MAGLNTIGVKFGYAAKGTEEYTYVTGVLEIPELGGDVDKIEVTTLNDTAHTYINGLVNNGDTMTFKCVYNETEFKAIPAEESSWIVDFAPTGATLKATWNGTATKKMDAVTVGGYLSYSVNIAPSTAVELA